MLKGFRMRSGDRRQRYSLRRHIARLKQEGRLPQIALAAMAVAIGGGIAFGQCDSSSITGPSEPVAASPNSPPVTSISGSVASASLGGSETFKDNTVERDVVFTGRNPCNGELVVARGKRHDKISMTASTNSFEVDHHLNDSFKSVALDEAGVEVNGPDLEYVGSDVHKDRLTIGLDGTQHRELTNEHLTRPGGPNWIFHLHQTSEFSYTDPQNASVSMRGHASCPPTSRCTMPGGNCPDRMFTLTSVTP
jgi:hypothetical protein